MPNGPFLEAFEKAPVVVAEEVAVEVPAEAVEESVEVVIDIVDDADLKLDGEVVEEGEPLAPEPPKTPTKTRGRKKKGE